MMCDEVFIQLLHSDIYIYGFWRGFRLSGHAALQTTMKSFLTMLTASPLGFEDNTNGTIRFRLATNCSKEDRGVIKLFRQQDDRLMCSVFLPLNPADDDQMCGCRAQKSQHLLCHYTQQMQRIDGGKWTLVAVGSTTMDEDFNIIITYSPVITQLTVDNYVDKSMVIINNNTQSVNITCNFTNGNPPSSIRLVGPENRTLDQSRVRGKGRLEASLTDLVCSDTGTYRCKADDSEQGIETVLLVKCPLRLKADMENSTLEVNEGENALLQLGIRSFTADGLTCSMTKLRSEVTSSATERDCTGDMVVKGSPPDITVSVVLSSIADSDSGTWRLCLSNGVGREDHTEVTLKVISDGMDIGISLTLVPFGVSMLGANGFIFIVVFVVVIFRKRGKRQSRLRNQHAIPLQDRQSAAHIYEEIPDEPLPRPPVCSRQRRDLRSIDSRPPAPPPIRFENSLSTSDESSSTDDSHNNGDTENHTLPSPSKQSTDSSEDDSHPHLAGGATTTDDQSIGCVDDDDYDDAYALSTSDMGVKNPRPSPGPFSRRKSQTDPSAEGDTDGRTVPPRCPKRKECTTRLQFPAQRLTKYKCKSSRPSDRAGVRGTQPSETSVDKQTDEGGYLHPISSSSLQEQQTQSPCQTDVDTNQLSADLQSSRHSKVFIVDDTYTHLTSPDSQQGNQSADSVGEERYQYTMLPKTKLPKAPDLRKRTGSDAYLHAISSVRENRTETQYGRSSDSLREEKVADICPTNKSHTTNEPNPTNERDCTSKSYPLKKSHPTSKSHPTKEFHVTNVSHPTNKSDPTNKSQPSKKSVGNKVTGCDDYLHPVAPTFSQNTAKPSSDMSGTTNVQTSVEAVSHLNDLTEDDAYLHPVFTPSSAQNN